MTLYRLTGNYGTFEISKIVEAEDGEGAFEQTGIMQDLIAVGWEFTSDPDGEEWEIEVVDA